MTAKDTQQRLNELFGNKDTKRAKEQLLAVMKKGLLLQSKAHFSPLIARFLSAFVHKVYTIKLLSFSPEEVSYFFNSFLEALTPVLIAMKTELNSYDRHHGEFHYDDDEDDWNEGYRKRLGYRMKVMEAKIQTLVVPIDHQHVITVLDLIEGLAHLSTHDYTIRTTLQNMAHKSQASYAQIIDAVDKFLSFVADALHEVEKAKNKTFHYQLP